MRSDGDEHDEVEALRAEVLRLQSQLSRRSGATTEANRVRSTRAADLDATVVELAREQYPYPLTPYFHPNWLSFTRMADLLNLRGIAAPRGGVWTARQVHRAIYRYLDREGFRVGHF